MTHGTSRMPTTTAVQNQGADSTLHPSSSRPVSAAGTRLRRRLSNNFHCDSIESGLGSRRASGPCTRRRSHPDELPVAADPATPARHVGAIARRKLLVQFCVAEESGAGVASLQKIVAQDAVCGKAPSERTLEGVDVVNALADERALVEDVLIHVRDRARVLVDPRRHLRTGARSATGWCRAGSRTRAAEGCA